MDSDASLLQRYLDGDDGAFTILVDRHYAIVWQSCRRCCFDASQADDACQAVFLTLAMRAQRLRRRRSIAGWLYLTAAHISRRLRDSERSRKQRERLAAEAQKDCRDQAAPNEHVDVHAAIASLGRRYREVVVLHYVHGLDQQDVAKRLGLRPSAVAMRLSRARRKLAARCRIDAALLVGLALLGPSKAALDAATLAQRSLATTRGLSSGASLATRSAIDLVSQTTRSLMMQQLQLLAVVLVSTVAIAAAGSLLWPDVKVVHAEEPPAPALVERLPTWIGEAALADARRATFTAPVSCGLASYPRLPAANADAVAVHCGTVPAFTISGGFNGLRTSISDPAMKEQVLAWSQGKDLAPLRNKPGGFWVAAIRGPQLNSGEFWLPFQIIRHEDITTIVLDRWQDPLAALAKNVSHREVLVTSLPRDVKQSRLRIVERGFIRQQSHGYYDLKALRYTELDLRTDLQTSGQAQWRSVAAPDSISFRRIRRLAPHIVGRYTRDMQRPFAPQICITNAKKMHETSAKDFDHQALPGRNAGDAPVLAIAGPSTAHQRGIVSVHDVFTTPKGEGQRAHMIVRLNYWQDQLPQPVPILPYQFVNVGWSGASRAPTSVTVIWRILKPYGTGYRLQAEQSQQLDIGLVSSWQPLPQQVLQAMQNETIQKEQEPAANEF